MKVDHLIMYVDAPQTELALLKEENNMISKILDEALNGLNKNIRV